MMAHHLVRRHLKPKSRGVVTSTKNTTSGGRAPSVSPTADVPLDDVEIEGISSVVQKCHQSL